jgi:hypothetical protein
MDEKSVIMPNGNPFSFWDDVTNYTQIYHVACENPNASDEATGTEERPFATIGRAAELLKPGEKVVVHKGVYRECVSPKCGGESPDRMIAYESAEGEEVFIKGSNLWSPEFKPADDWNFGGAKVWMGELPKEWFIGYNPFMTMNFSSEYTTFTRDWSDSEITTFMLKRGMVFANNKPLKQVFRSSEMAKSDGVFWADPSGLKLYIRLWNDEDPNGKAFEVTAREQCFAPNGAYGYMRVSGFHFEHCADGIPVPQRAMVSAGLGHHWIIEDNYIKWANACGIDVGNESWHRVRHEKTETSGGHIIRRNHVSECGICGIEAVGNNANSLVENNTVEHIGSMNIERIWECGGLKFHTCDSVLIRNNVFRHTYNAPGLWLDYLNKNCRVTGNVFADIDSILGGIYIEVSHELNVVDHNILWDIRGAGRSRSGPGINVDTGEKCVVANNLLGKIKDGYAVSISLNQNVRVVGGRVGLCRRHKVMNNILVGCPKRIMLSRIEDNKSDNNLFDSRDDATSLCIEYPAPQALVNLSAWQDYYWLDSNSKQAQIEANFDPETLKLTLKIDGETPKCKPIEELHDSSVDYIGAIRIESGKSEYQIVAGKLG